MMLSYRRLEMGGDILLHDFTIEDIRKSRALAAAELRDWRRRRMHPHGSRRGRQARKSQIAWLKFDIPLCRYHADERRLLKEVQLLEDFVALCERNFSVLTDGVSDEVYDAARRASTLAAKLRSAASRHQSNEWAHALILQQL